MTYRVFQPSDLPAVKALCEKHSLPMPTVGVCFVAEQDGKVVGFVNGGLVGYVETIVSENPLTANTLFAMMEGNLLSNTTASILAGVSNGEAGDILERVGYEKSKRTFYLKRR